MIQVRIAIAAALCLGLASTAMAQSTAVAEVSGVVTDPTGNVVVNAQVSMTETDKHLVRVAATDAGGRYTLANLPVGPYRLEVTTPGFKNRLISAQNESSRFAIVAKLRARQAHHSPAAGAKPEISGQVFRKTIYAQVAEAVLA